MNRKTLGFTLLELMIAVAIMGVLASIAIPSYRNYLNKARRADAKAGLHTLQLDMEKYRTNCISFPTAIATPATACDGNVRSSALSPDKHYSLSITASSTNLYTLKAAPSTTGVGGTDLQLGDKCGNFYINQSGVKWVTTTASGYDTSTCW